MNYLVHLYLYGMQLCGCVHVCRYMLYVCVRVHMCMWMHIMDMIWMSEVNLRLVLRSRPSWFLEIRVFHWALGLTKGWLALGWLASPRNLSISASSMLG